MKDYYEILEVNEHASQEVIEKAYRVLIKKYHPDLYTNEEKEYAEQKLRDINEAYKILSDDFLKSQYDRELVKTKAEAYLNTPDTNIRKEVKVRNNKKNKERQSMFNNRKKEDVNIRRNDVGSLRGIVGVLQEVFKSTPSREDIKKIGKVDFLALGLTIVCLIIIGIILWFIPFTNGWMRQLIFENPLISWMFK